MGVTAYLIPLIILICAITLFCIGSVNCLSLIMHFCQLCSFIFFRVGAYVLYGAVLVGFFRVLLLTLLLSLLPASLEVWLIYL